MSTNATELSKEEQNETKLLKAMVDAIDSAGYLNLQVAETTFHTVINSRAVQTAADNTGIVYEQYQVTVERLPFNDDEQLASLDN